jgi:hypothetical protein
LEEHYNLGVLTPTALLVPIVVQLEEHYNLGVLTPHGYESNAASCVGTTL